MSLPPHPRYRESGVEWLGPVPGHWDVQRLKNLCQVLPSNVDKKSQEGEPSIRLCNYTDVYYNDRIVAGMDFMAATAPPDQIRKFTLRAGDTIVTKDSETPDDIAISAFVPEDLPGVVCGYHLAIVRPRVDAIEGAFVKRLFDSAYAKSTFHIRANGLTRYGLAQSELDTAEFPVPPVEEQRAIVAFLDRETAKIDALVAEQERLIELLKEKRQAVISHAVTKGLNPDARMKDSGVKWLGEVPSYWHVMRLRYALESAKAGPFGSALTKEMYSTAGIRVYGQEQVIPGDFSIGNYYIDEALFQTLRQYSVSAGDILVSCVGTFGKIAIVPEHAEPGIINPRLLRLRCSARLVPEFLADVLRGAVTFEQFASASRGGTMDVINMGTLSNIWIVVPPMTEQQVIHSALRRTTEQLDSLTAETKRAVLVLQERRTALISAAVTGQIDVRAASEAAP